jgi:hypothetical protein
MSDYSIELSAEKIVDSRTRRYFAEVHGCYSAGYYRSAVVMLWSVVVTDILFKLDQLANAYADATAQAILTEIGDIRKNNPKSPEWEAELVNKVASRTDLLDHAEHSFLQSLQAHRHLSAHPVMTGVDALFSPNKETARAHIRNVLDGVLTKPPIMSRKVFDTFIEDVEQVGRLSPGPEGLKKFLEAKYFRHFSAATFAHILKSTWRVAFKSTDPRADTNRVINAQALGVVFANRKAELTELIKTERDWFSDVSFLDSHIAAMTQFFRENPQVFPLLNDALKTPLQNYAALSLDHFAACWFVSPSPDAHVEEILRRIVAGEGVRPDIYKELCTSLSTSDALVKALHIGIRLYCRSGSFATADSRFDEMVRPFIPLYQREHIVALLAGCETCYNMQATGRGRAWRDHHEIKSLMDVKFADIKLDEYPEFKKSLGE